VASEERNFVLNLVRMLQLIKRVREGTHDYIGPTCIMTVFYAWFLSIRRKIRLKTEQAFWQLSQRNNCQESPV